ncbi:MAG: ABC transporter substrate-binding protein [Chloroflexi bacterium]|nr:ABC transporter substrate-binding protein [Chloroflexota bacterium]
MFKAYRWLSIAVILSALWLSACSGGSSPPTVSTDANSSGGESASTPAANQAASEALNRDPKTLVVLYNESADNMDPGQTLNVANNVVQRGIYEGLLRLKGSSVSEVEGVLAESWTTNDDKSEWTFKIRQGVKFHDGTTCDAQAIYDSMARTLVNQLPASFILARFIGDAPDQVMKVVDPYTLQFTFSQPQPLFDLGLAAAYGTGIVSPTAFKENEKDGDVGKEWLTTHAVGTGAYKLEKFAPNDEFILVRNPDYWRGWSNPNQFEKVIVKPIPEASTTRQIMEKGDADIKSPGFNNPEDTLALEQTSMFNIGNVGQIRIDYALYNPHGKLKDPRTRQAISYAFDYDGYINGVRKGDGRQAEGPFPRNLAYHDPNVFVYKTDLDKAKSMFDEAGWNYDDEITFTYYPGFGGENVGPILQAQLQQIGVKMKIEERDISSFNGIFYGDTPPEERPDLMWYAWWPNLNDAYDESWILYHSDAAGSAGANAGFYSNKRVDELIDAGYTETDPEKLKAMWDEVQKLITVDDPAGLWVEDPLERTIIRKDIEGHVYNAIYAVTFDYWALTRKAQ